MDELRIIKREELTYGGLYNLITKKNINNQAQHHDIKVIYCSCGTVSRDTDR
jgi:hypothetical protein